MIHAKTNKPGLTQTFTPHKSAKAVPAMKNNRKIQRFRYARLPPAGRYSVQCNVSSVRVTHAFRSMGKPAQRTLSPAIFDRADFTAPLLDAQIALSYIIVYSAPVPYLKLTSNQDDPDC